MKYLSFFILTGLFNLCLFSQTDSILAENIFKYELKNGRATRNRIIVMQNTYNLHNTLLRQNYYDSLTNIDRSTIFFYKDDKLVSEETYGADFEIDSVRRLHYNPEGLKDQETLYLINDGNIEKVSWIKYTYENNELAEKKVYGNTKKWKTKTSFERNNDTLVKSIVFRKGTRSSDVKELLIEEIYEGEKPASAKIIKIHSDKSVVTAKILYEYDTTNYQLIGMKWLTENDSLLKEVLYRYYPDGHIRSKSTRLSSGDYIEHLVHERRNHVIVLGKPEMYAIPTED